MALNIITEAMIAEYGVQSAPDQLSGTAAENKAVFDRLITNVVAVYFNQLVEALTAATGANEIGFGETNLGEAVAASVKTITVDADTKNIVVTMQDGTVHEYNVAGEGGEAVAGKSTIEDATLAAANWNGQEYDLAMEGVTTVSNQEILPALHIGEEALLALQKANIQDNGQEEGVMHLIAYGEVPATDIPLRVILRGD